MRRQTGVTLVEVLFVVVVLGALSAMAMIKSIEPGRLTLHAQAQSAADLVRRAQSQAMSRGQRMCVSVIGGALAIARSNGALPCINEESYSAGQDVAIGGSSTVHFNSLGQPIDPATGSLLSSDSSYSVSFTTGGSTSTFTITVAALTGRVSLSP